ncbi:MAG: C39 family peptidase [Oscillospiraceae bacterium]|nr:C39 family peptidase [Oscillospiraceae bacterium]
MKFGVKFLSFLSSALIATTSLNVDNLMALDETKNTFSYATGGKYSLMVDENSLSKENVERSYNYPSSYDITTNSSTSSYFPEIGNQGSVPSCTAWATTYYQYTYEVNKLRNTPATSENIYSPSWTYNYINGGTANNTYLEHAYNILENQGAMKLVDYPHSSNISTYNYNWCTDSTKLIDALEYRGKSSYTINDIQEAKYRISQGKPAVVWTNTSTWTIVTNSNNEDVIVRGGTANDSGHFMTIVGYDDNFTVTVNGVTLTGAFKLANSWGDNWGNDGYIWVSYDALNLYSSYGTTWQNDFDDYTRGRIFGGNSFNQFSFLDVYHCDVYYAGVADLYSNDMWGVNILTKYNNNSNFTKLHNIDDFIPKSTSSRYMIAFDYFDVYGSESLSLSNQFRTIFNGDGSQSTYNIKVNIFDNLHKIITSSSGGRIPSSGQYTFNNNVYLAKGRVSSYDNSQITVSDVDLVRYYLLGDIQFSNLQLYLADYNSDGVVSLLDVVEMHEYVSSLNRSKNSPYSLTDYESEWGCSLADIIENDFGISIEDFISDNYTHLSSLGIALNY